MSYYSSERVCMLPTPGSGFPMGDTIFFYLALWLGTLADVLYDVLVAQTAVVFGLGAVTSVLLCVRVNVVCFEAALPPSMFFFVSPLRGINNTVVSIWYHIAPPKPAVLFADGCVQATRAKVTTSTINKC